jgi:hypothetical protein
MNLNERFNRLDTFIAEDRLVRRMWGDGQERACLLLALAPEVGAEGAVARCPASVLPPWLAELTPNLDDFGTEAAWPAMMRRYSHVVRRGAETLDDEGWRRVLARFLIAVLAEATPRDASGSCQRVAALWLCVLAGDEPGAEEWTAAWAVPWTAAWTAGAEAAHVASRAAARAEAAEAASRVMAVVAAAVWAATRAATRAEATAAREVAEAAAWDRITAALLDGIEIECGVSREEGE